MQDILLLLLTTECTYLLLLIIDGSMISHIWVPNHLHAQLLIILVLKLVYMYSCIDIRRNNPTQCSHLLCFEFYKLVS